MAPGAADRQVGSNPEEPGPNLFGRSAGTRLGRQTQERFLEEIFSGAGIAGRTDQEGIDLRVMGLVHRDHETVRPTRKLTNHRSVELIQRRRTFHVTYNARRAALFVGGDTGPLHIAAASGTPIVGLYGPTSPIRNGPFDPLDITLGRDVWCRADCHRRSCWHWECMDIPVNDVKNAIVKRLQR